MQNRRSLFRGRFLPALLALAGSFAAASAIAQMGHVGLSSVRSARFGNEDLLFYTPAAGDRFGHALTTGDFNGDGADDLATAIPFHDNLGGSHPGSGVVVVRFGLPGLGLESGLADLVLSQAAVGSPDPPEAGDGFGYSLAACDFNGDGYADLAVGVPQENVGGEEVAGAVQIHLGWLTGLPADADQFFTQNTSGIPGDAENGDWFGNALACGDFDNDGFDDLAIGSVYEDFGIDGTSGIEAGMVIIVPGGELGLEAASAFNLDQDTPGMNGSAETSDHFGAALAVGDFNGDGFADLAIGVPGEDGSEGAVQIVFGSASGLTSAGDVLWQEGDLPGGVSEVDDYFGDSLAAGDFDGDGRDDLLIGVPLEDFDGGAIVQGGQAYAVYGTVGGFDLTRTQRWLEDFIVGFGTTESGDLFASALAVGDFDADGFDDAAFGQPGEFALVPADGGITLLMGSPSGLTSARYRGLVLGHEGIPGQADQAHRLFGWSLTTGDFDGDGHGDLVVGAPWENAGGLADVGGEIVLYGSLWSDGFETSNADLWSASVP